MAPRKGAAKKAASKTAVASAEFKPSKAGAEKDKEDRPPVFRTDLGESLPAQKDSFNPNRAK